MTVFAFSQLSQHDSSIALTLTSEMVRGLHTRRVGRASEEKEKVKSFGENTCQVSAAERRERKETAYAEARVIYHHRDLPRRSRSSAVLTPIQSSIYSK